MRYLRSLLATLLSIASVHARGLEVKEIHYGGGLVNFSVPQNWVEESEPDGTGMYYENAPDTGTLRLRVITAKAPKALSDDAAVEALATLKSVNAGSIQRLENGNAIATSIRHTTENGQAITLFWWYVANPVRPDHMRIAMFSYTVLTTAEASEAVKHGVQLLTEAIKGAKFHPTIGQ